MQPRKFEYKKIPDGDPLPIFLFDPQTKGEGSRPGVLFFHGGGWEGGNPVQFFPHCEALAEEGFVALSSGYRIKGVHGTSPMEAVSDARSSVRWVIEHATELGLDTSRLILGGGSAGGHLALASLLTSAFDDPGDDISIKPHAAGLVLFNPVADCGPEGYGYEMVREHLGDISPLHAFKGGLPPIQIQSGTGDDLTPITMQRAFRDLVVDSGGSCELIDYPGQPHGFFNWSEDGNPYYEKTLQEMLRFVRNITGVTN